MEVESSARLFGGRRKLLEQIRAGAQAEGVQAMTVAPTALAAQALLEHLLVQQTSFVHVCHREKLQETIDALPLERLPAVRAHAPILHRLGCRTFGQVRKLPRGGLSRRFGAGLLDAIDRAYGIKNDAWEWLEAPEQFKQRIEFIGNIEVAQGLMFGANRLLSQLKSWLLARQCGVLEIRMTWEHDKIRRSEISEGEMIVGTAQATRDMNHITRLLSENLARTHLAAPATALRIEATKVESLEVASNSLLPQEGRTGESFTQLIERLSARLGADHVLQADMLSDHRPQHAQRWRAASTTATASATKDASALNAINAVTMAATHASKSAPPWMLRKPLKLAIVKDRPCYQGALTLVAGPERIEGGWWSPDDLTVRDYFIARSPSAGFLWIYRQMDAKDAGWYLHGMYG